MVAAAVIGSAVVGAAASANASSKASKASSEATRAAAAGAEAATELGYEELDFAKQQYQDGKPFRDKASEMALRVAEQQLASQTNQDALAKEYSDYWRGTYQPLEKGIVDSAAGYDTTQRRNAAADTAVAGVDMQFGRMRDAANREMESYGLNPGSARAIAARGGIDIAQATAGAGAARGARQQIETQGFARKMDAASLGRNLPSNQATSAGIALNAGNAAVANGMNGVNANAAGGAAMMAGYQGAIGANLGAAGIQGQVAGLNQRSADSSNAMWGSLGSAAGQFAGSRYGSQLIADYLKPTPGG